MDVSAALAFVILITVLAWVYDFYNGANDAANAIATTVSTRVLTPTQALLLAAVFNVAGAFLSTRVAKTIGKGIVEPTYLDGVILVSALVGAIVWLALATRRGLPVSVTHALVGGIVGSVLIPHGLAVVKLKGLMIILAGMLLSPLLGFIIGALFLAILYELSARARPAVAQQIYGKLQLLSASFMAVAHGTNDTQNSMGIITAGLFASGFLTEFEVPLWVIVGSGVWMGVGTYQGGRKVIKTLGMKLARLKPVHGFAAETSSVLVILGATFLGIPISTTHAITTSVMGVGVVDRVRAVRWHVARSVVGAWLLTIPGAALAAAACYAVLRLFL